jgi:hypothetical protein
MRVVDEWLRWDIFPLDRIQSALRGIKSSVMEIPTGSPRLSSEVHTALFPHSFLTLMISLCLDD